MNPNWRPDWRDENQYTDHGENGIKWLWEFLRRDEKFIDEIPAIQKLCDSLGMRETELYKQGIPEKLEAYSKQFGIVISLGSKLNPANDNPYLNPFVSRTTYLYRGYCNNGSIEPLDETEAAFKFDLTLPVNAQLENVKAELQGMKNYLDEKYPSIAKQRREWTQLLRFIRILDAINADASKSEQAKILLNLAHTPTSDEFKTLQDSTDAAIRMGNMKYRQLAMNDVRAYVQKSYYRKFYGDSKKK